MKDRLWQIGFMLSIIAAFVIGGVVAQSPQVQVILRGQRIELTDASGKVLGLIAPDSQGNGSITLYDKAGKVTWKAPDIQQTAVTAPPTTESRKKTDSSLGLTVYGLDIRAGASTISMPGGKPQPILGTERVLASGYVKNESAQSYSRVSLALVYYDKAGIQIGDDTVTTHNLASGSVWRFQIPVYLDSGSPLAVKRIAVADVKAQ